MKKLKTIMGRKRKTVSLEQLTALASIQCTDAEICAVLGVSATWLKEKEKTDPIFLEVIKKGREMGKESLRRRQWKCMQDGNVTMLIWLGKQYLKQTDKQEVQGQVVYEERIGRWLSDNRPSLEEVTDTIKGDNASNKSIQ